MWFHSLLASWKSGLSRRRRSQPRPARRGTRLALEELESRLTPSLSVLASFNGTDGKAPAAGLIMDSSGNLYGTTSAYDGTVFELAHGSGAITTLAKFNGTNGAEPEGSLIMDSSGNLYGTTFEGGAFGDGTIFELVHGSGTIITLASFNGTDGEAPEAGLIMASGGNLYGTTAGGGAFHLGTVFELAHGSSTVVTLASFNGTNGASPEAALIIDSSGNLYGTTDLGGPSASFTPSSTASDYGYGTVFELAAGSHPITTLASFNGTNGAYPKAGLIMDSSGNLYGTTYGGGFNNYGTVFELAYGSSMIVTLASFNGYDGACPEASLIMDSSGNLYGTTYGSLSVGMDYLIYHPGTVFEVVHGSDTLNTLVTFSSLPDGAYPDGASPAGTLVMDSSGNLYGTASGGGRYSDGTVFKLQAPAATE